MKEYFIKIGLLCLLVLGFITLIPQDRKQLEKKKKQTEAEIKLTKKILEQTGKEKKDNLHSLNVIKNLIKARERLIHTLSQQVNQVAKELEEQREELIKMEIKLAKEKENYSKLIVTSFKTRSNYNDFSFIFSASSFFNALNRLKFLKLINTEQDRLVESIADKKEQISLTIIRLEELKAEKEALLENRIEERGNLENDRVKKDEIVKTLSGKEEELKAKLKKQQAAFEDLNRQIKLAIQREMEEARKKREAEAKKQGTSKENIDMLTPEAQALSNDFAGNRLKLPWPVEKGFITQKFGRFAHQTLSGIYIENNGIDITTEQNVKARAVFRGEVSAVFPVPGMGKAVLINHGEYYTVYARLDEVFVKQGQKVNIKEPLGVIHTDENGKTELHFEVWKNQEKLNPELWLTKR